MSFWIWISSALDPLDVDRTIFMGEGVVTDCLRVGERSSARTGAAGVPERTAGVNERCGTLVGCTDADLVCSGVEAIREVSGECTAGTWLYGVGDVGEVARDRGSEVEDVGDVGAAVLGRVGERSPPFCREV